MGNPPTGPAGLTSPVVLPMGTPARVLRATGGDEMIWLINRLLAEALVRSSATVDRFRVEIRNGADLAATNR